MLHSATSSVFCKALLKNWKGQGFCVPEGAREFGHFLRLEPCSDELHRSKIFLLPQKNRDQLRSERDLIGGPRANPFDAAPDGANRDFL